VSQAIDGAGSWFCAVTAFNDVGESGTSNEVNFKAGDLPNNPFGFGVVSE
jgi:hypothetical protein